MDYHVKVFLRERGGHLADDNEHSSGESDRDEGGEERPPKDDFHDDPLASLDDGGAHPHILDNVLGQLLGASVEDLSRQKIHRLLVVSELHGAALGVEREPGHVVLTQPLHCGLPLVVKEVLGPFKESRVVDVGVVCEAVVEASKWNH